MNEAARTETPLFLLSFRQRDELAELAAGAGWRVVAARRADGAERRFLASGASVAVIDARGALADGLAATSSLAAAAADNGAALLVLVSRNDAGRLGDFLDAGATHFAVSPVREQELVQALRFAERHAERVGGGWAPHPSGAAEPLGWRWDPRLRSLQLTPDLARLLDLPIAPGVKALLRRIDREDRRNARAALARLREGAASTAFAHEMPGAGRVVHHLQRDGRTGRLHALIEPLGEAPDASAVLRDAISGSERRWMHHRLPDDVERALEHGEIEIRFQPQVEVATRRIVGVEALARWRHPVLGEVGAEALFGAAERAGLEVAVSEHVQQRALETAAAWRTVLGELRLSVNVTSADIARPEFVDRFLGRVDASGFPRARLTVEITEGGLIEELAQAAELLGELRSAGCRVAIDDFGTGYSSLAYLNALPLDYLKIDKRLSQDIAGSERDRVVVRGVIEMAHSLGFAVIAEGVETEDQLALLAQEGCRYYQGFLCAEPLEVEALERLVVGAGT